MSTANADVGAPRDGRPLAAVAAINPDRAQRVQALSAGRTNAPWHQASLGEVRDTLVQTGILDDLRRSVATITPRRITGYMGKETRSALVPADRSFALVPLPDHRSVGSGNDQIRHWTGKYALCSPAPNGAWRPIARVEISGQILAVVDGQGRRLPLFDGGPSIQPFADNETFVPVSAALHVVIDPSRHAKFEGGVSRGSTCDVLMADQEGKRTIPGILKTVRTSLAVESTVNGYLAAAEVLQRNPAAGVVQTIDAGFSSDVPYGRARERTFYAIDEFLAGGATLETCLIGDAVIGGVRLGVPNAQETATLIGLAARTALDLNRIRQPDGTYRKAETGEHIGHTDLKPDNFIIHMDAAGTRRAVIIDKDAFVREGRMTIPGAHQSALYGDLDVANQITDSPARSVMWTLVERNMVAQLGVAILSRWPDFEPRLTSGQDFGPFEIACQKYRREWSDSIRRSLQPANGTPADRLLTLASAAVADDVSRRPTLEEFVRRLDMISRPAPMGQAPS